MTQYRSHTIKFANIPNEKRLICSTNKAVMPILIATAAASVIVCFTEFKVVAVPFALYVLFALTRKSELVFAGYESFIVYASDEEDKGNIIYFSEIDSWTFNKAQDGPILNIKLNSGEVLQIEKGLNSFTYKYLVSVLKEKEAK